MIFIDVNCFQDIQHKDYPMEHRKQHVVLSIKQLGYNIIHVKYVHKTVDDVTGYMAF